MATLEFDNTSQRYRVRFRFGRREYKRSLKTSDKRESRALLGRIEDTILQIERGRLLLPPNADPAAFILSDGKLARHERPAAPLSLKGLFEIYQEKLPPGAKEESTLQGERIHFKHLLKILGSSRVAQSLVVPDVQGYAATRSKQRYRKRPIRAATIKKELTTLRLVWNWAVSQGLLQGASPVRDIIYPKPDEKQVFRTRLEIERIVARGGLTKDEIQNLWDGLYLSRDEVHELLEHVRKSARLPFIYPMFVFVAHTGARRSELLRSRVDDFDFNSGTVAIREKKKSRTFATTFRRVEMTSLLAATMREWFTTHPGGQYSLTSETKKPLSVHEAHDHFKRALANTTWSNVRGFHVFRHSFCSNLAAAGVDQRVIDEFAGHTTEEMRRRYRHLMPDTRRRAIEVLSVRKDS